MRRWLRWTLRGVGGFVALVLAAFAWGATLPVEHAATTSRVVPGDPEAVWSVVTGVGAFTSWRPGVESVELLPPVAGLPAWRESGATGSMTLEVTAFEPPRRMVTRIADEGAPFGGTWTYRLEGAESGTRVTLTEDGEIYNPFFRFVARYVIGYDGTMNAYLDGLEARMGGGAG
jgi:hypothetical protein